MAVVFQVFVVKKNLFLPYQVYIACLYLNVYFLLSKDTRYVDEEFLPLRRQRQKERKQERLSIYFPA